MYKVIIFSLIATCGFISPVIARSDNQDTDQENIYERSLTKAGASLPKFTDYPSQVARYTGKIADLDLSSHNLAQKYKTKIIEGLHLGPNFAGKFHIISVGTGTTSQLNIVVDCSTGKIVDSVSSEFGIDHRVDSSLLIINRLDKSTVEYIAGKSKLAPDTDYYVLENDKLKKIKSIPVYKYSKELLQAK